ncbi:ThiF family adenylyltransferase [Candidatus Uhrbacteria bacterium]|nr:ThiF family adenylyltransferase [Candidatus Uhrbacteria bacterium]
MKHISRIVIVGLGGVGTRIAPILCQYLTYEQPGLPVFLIDGDKFEPKNAQRQIFTSLGNKAEVTAGQLRKDFPELSIEAKTQFVTDDNVYIYIPEGSLVFCCVDNHASRKLLSEHCRSLENTTLISGGNEFDDGNIQVYIRESGKNLTPPLTHLHPEIMRPKDRNPAELDCMELSAAGTPQLIFANVKVATEMLCAFWVVTKKEVVFSEVYFDLKTGAQRPILRKE